jgi:hypothetical protein
MEGGEKGRASEAGVASCCALAAWAGELGAVRGSWCAGPGTLQSGEERGDAPGVGMWTCSHVARSVD